METQAENFLDTILRISNDEEGNIGIEFKDGSVIDYNIDSCRFKLFTKPMTKENITKNGNIGHGAYMDEAICKSN